MSFVKILSLTAAAFCAAGTASAQDWTGFYGGVSVETDVNSDWSFVFDGSPISAGDYNPETAGGVFAGYNFQRGTVVYGGELAFAPSKLGIGPNSHFESWTDLKAHVGYASGAAMVYGILGYTLGDYVDGGTTEHLRPDGVNYGVGASYRFNDRFFAGAEYLIRDIKGDYPDNPTDFETTIKTLSLRVGMTF